MVDSRDLPAYGAELLGSFLLTLFVGFIVSDLGLAGYGDAAALGLVHAFILFVLVYTLGGLSGGHFNPAVTIAVAAVGKIAPAKAVVYVVVQIAGGLLAALVVRALIHELGRPAHYGAVSPSHIINGASLTAAFIEAIGTFVLVWTIFAVAVSPRGGVVPGWAPFAIGAALGVSVMIFAPFTGAGFNPQRALGPAVVSGSYGTGGARFLVIYILAPIAGALGAALAHTVLNSERWRATAP